MKKFLLHLLLLFVPLMAQDNDAGNEFDDKAEDYRDLMQNGEYKAAANILMKQIDQRNSERVDRKEIPSDFVSFAALEDDVDLQKLFNERKLDNYVIEENSELHTLHRDAGICFQKMKDYRRSVKHFQQALRFKKIEFKKDDLIFYNLAISYKEMGELEAYYNSLEAAYLLDRTNFDYSKELGLALYKSRKRKKAIYHLKNYADNISQAKVDPDIYIKLGNLYADETKYLESEKYYSEYLKVKKEDGKIYYALGVLAYQKTGNFELALSCFASADNYLDDTALLERSRLREYSGDIFKKRLKYKIAAEWYEKSIQFESSAKKEIEKKNSEIKKLQASINELKKSLLKQNDFVKYNEYQFQSQESDRIQYEKMQLEYEYRKYNAGQKRWKLAECYEKTGELDKALARYQEAVSFNFQANRARERIQKIKLKLKRGY